ncbi:hypothetical protein [Thermosipho ferrireducens]|nr:hypothetical protein [Thermosipho ferrireducens]
MLARLVRTGKIESMLLDILPSIKNIIITFELNINFLRVKSI